MNIVGVDIGGTKMYLCIPVDGTYIEHTVPTSKECTPDYLREEIHKFLSRLPVKVDAMGIGISGMVSGDQYVAHSVTLPNLNGITAYYFSDGMDAWLLNDLRCATYAEVANYPNDEVLVVVLVGSGTAAGIAIDGTVLGGSIGFAGEVGYFPVMTETGIQYEDDMSGGNALLRKTGLTPQELLEKIEKKESESVQLIETAGTYFGMAMAGLINILNPSKLIVGGRTITYPGYLDQAMKVCDHYALLPAREACSILPPSDAVRSVALGAIEYVKRKYSDR